MAPSSMTQTSLLKPDHSMYCNECKISHDTKFPTFNNNFQEIKEEETFKSYCRSKLISFLAPGKRVISPVYDETRPKNEPHYLKPLRDLEKDLGFVTSLRWRSIIGIAGFHIIATTWILCSLAFGYFPSLPTVIFGYFWGQISGFGVTAGAHRLWCHRSYKAKWPLQIILLICYSVAGQNKVFEWVRDHRVHHKFSETDADPHNVNRGFFFAHVGWLMMRKHPDVLREGAKIDISDITQEPFIQFHTRHFTLFKMIFCFLLPTVVPVMFWGESWHYAILSQPVLRYILSLNATWAVNSFAHLWGNKPYDKHIMPVENWGVSLAALGEGWHNYHHTFPWDYKAAELAYNLNLTTIILDIFAKIGWAYDMKVASPSLVKSVMQKRGESIS